MTDKVLLTGVSGWIAKHTAIELLNGGYEVLGTVRNKDLIDQTKETISKYAPTEKLSFVEFIVRVRKKTYKTEYFLGFRYFISVYFLHFRFFYLSIRDK